MENVEYFGTGCIRTPEKVKENHFVLKVGTPDIIDWNTPYMVEDGFYLDQRNQGSSLSCTCEGVSYSGEAWMYKKFGKKERYSARYTYSQVALPDGGAYIYQAMSIPLKKGFASLNSVPEGMTEDIMKDSSLNDSAVIEAFAQKYAQLPSTNIDYLAQVIKEHNGFVTGFEGNNSIVQTPILSIPNSVDWGHCVWICGYKLLDDGRKALIFKNSWGNNWGDNGYGYITEEFINSGHLFDAYTYADIKDIEKTMRKLIKREGDEDVYYIDSNGNRVQIADERTFVAYSGILWGDWSDINIVTDEEFNAITKSGIIVKTKSN